MRYRETFAVAALAAATLAPLPSAAATRVDLYIGSPPPAVVYEPVPGPRVGYVWSPGYWDWNGHRHVWHRGHWVREVRGQHYVAGGWYQRDGRWYLTRPHWEHRNNYSRNYYGHNYYGPNYYGRDYYYGHN